MSGPTFRFSGDLAEFFQKSDFYDSLGKTAQEKSLRLKLWADEKAGYHDPGFQVLDKPDGGSEVIITLALDDNNEAKDGHLLVRDHFSFDPQGEFTHERKFDFKGEGKKSKQWEDLEKAFRDPSKAGQVGDLADMGFNRAVAQKFGEQVARTLLRHRFFQQSGKFYGPLYEAADENLDFNFLSPECGAHVRPLPDGGTEVSFVTVLDDNGPAEDGRIVVSDRFIFAASKKGGEEKKMEGVDIDLDAEPFWHHRDFEYQGPSPRSQVWTTRLNTLREKAKDVDGAVSKKFGETWAVPLLERTRSTTVQLDTEFFQEIQESGAGPLAFMRGIGDAARNVDGNLVENFDHKQSYYALKVVDGRLEVELNILLNDEASEGNRVLARDVFVLDLKTNKLESHRRKWNFALDAALDDEQEGKIERIRAQAVPDAKAAEEFIQTLRPFLIKKALKDSSWGEDTYQILLQAEGSKTRLTDVEATKKVEKAAQTKSETQEKERQQRLLGSLELVHALYLDRLGQRVDRSKGWFYFGPEVEAEREGRLLGDFIAKLKTKIETKPEQTLLENIQKLKLKGEAEIRDRLVADEILRDLSVLFEEKDANRRAKSLVYFAQKDLFQEQHMGFAAQKVAEYVKQSAGQTVKASDEQLKFDDWILKNSKDAAERSDALRDSKKAETSKNVALLISAENHKLLSYLDPNAEAALGTKLQFEIPRFFGNIFNGPSLLAFAGAPFVGGMTRVGLTRVLGTGIPATLTATGLGLFAEANAFTTIHKTGEAAFHDPSQLFTADSYWKETGVAFGLFAATRGVHWGTGKLSEQIAKSRWGGVAPELRPPQFQVTPMGTVVSGKLVPALNPLGKGVAFTLHHGGGLGVMYGVTKGAQELDWQEARKQGFTGDAFDASSMYAGAILGGRMANMGTGYYAPKKLAEYRYREIFAEYAKEIPATPETTPSQPGMIPFKPDQTNVAGEAKVSATDNLLVSDLAAINPTSEARPEGENSKLPSSEPRASEPPASEPPERGRGERPSGETEPGAEGEGSGPHDRITFNPISGLSPVDPLAITTGPIPLIRPMGAAAMPAEAMTAGARSVVSTGTYHWPPEPLVPWYARPFNALGRILLGGRITWLQEQLGDARGQVEGLYLGGQKEAAGRRRAEATLSGVREKLNAAVQKAEETTRQLEQEKLLNEMLIGKANDAQALKNSAEAELNTLKTNYESLQASFAGLQEALLELQKGSPEDVQEGIEIFNRQNRDLLQANRSLTQDLGRARNSEKDSVAQLTEIREQKHELNQRIAQLEAEAAKVPGEKQELQDQIDAAKDAKVQLENAIKEKLKPIVPEFADGTIDSATHALNVALGRIQRNLSSLDQALKEVDYLRGISWATAQYLARARDILTAQDPQLAERLEELPAGEDHQELVDAARKSREGVAQQIDQLKKKFDADKKKIEGKRDADLLDQAGKHDGELKKLREEKEAEFTGLKHDRDGLKSRVTEAEKQAREAGQAQDAAERKARDLEAKLEVIERQETLRQNRQILAQIKFAPEPNTEDNIGRGNAPTGLKYGEIIMDESGKITALVPGFAPAKFQPNAGPSKHDFPTRRDPDSIQVIIDGEGTVLMAPSTKPKLTAKQQAAIEDLCQGKDLKWKRDPYSVQVLVGSQLGPLAQDLYFLFKQFKSSTNSLGIVFETAKNAAGVEGQYYRVYDDSPDPGTWANDAKIYLNGNSPQFPLVGDIQLNFVKETNGDGNPNWVLEYRLTSGLPQETKTEIEKMIHYFGRMRAHKVRPMTVPPAAVPHGGTSARTPGAAGSRQPMAAARPAAGSATRQGLGTNGNPPGTVGDLPPPPFPPPGLGGPKPPSGRSGPRERQDTIPDSENFPTPALGTPAVDPHAVFGAIQPGPSRPRAADRSGARAIEPDLDGTAKTNPLGRAVSRPGNAAPGVGIVSPHRGTAQGLGPAAAAPGAVSPPGAPPRSQATQSLGSPGVSPRSRTNVGMGPPPGAPPPPSARRASGMGSSLPLPGEPKRPSPVPPPPRRSPVPQARDSDRPTSVPNGRGILPPVPKPPPLPDAYRPEMPTVNYPPEHNPMKASYPGVPLAGPAAAVAAAAAVRPRKPTMMGPPALMSPAAHIPKAPEYDMINRQLRMGVANSIKINESRPVTGSMGTKETNRGASEWTVTINLMKIYEMAYKGKKTFATIRREGPRDQNIVTLSNDTVDTDWGEGSKAGIKIQRINGAEGVVKRGQKVRLEDNDLVWINKELVVRFHR